MSKVSAKIPYTIVCVSYLALLSILPRKNSKFDLFMKEK